jgi:Uma2 family endonuclease
MTTKQKLITAEELLLMPRDGNRYELVRGVLVQKMPTGDLHRVTVSRIDAALSIWSDENDYGSVGAGEPGYRLDRDPDTVRAPDVVWIAPGRIPEGTQGYPELAPDLAVEVKSPGNSNPEMAAKAAMWLSYGSREVWVADPETTTITRHRPNAAPVTLGEDDILDGDELLPGFSAPVWRLFRRRRAATQDPA